MNGEELRARLDGRPYAWLAVFLGVSRSLVCKWAHDQAPVPVDRADVIRVRLPLPGRSSVEVDGGGE